MRLRSLLYVPADNPRFVAKAHTRGADAIILDLEDSVLPVNKGAARAGLVESVAQAGQTGARVFVRINNQRETALEDAQAAHAAGAFGLYVPKADTEQLRLLDAHLTRLEQRANCDPMVMVAVIEDPGGVLRAAEIARQNRVIALTCGGEDIAARLGAEAIPDVVRIPKLLVHYAAKAEGLLSFGLLQTASHYTDIDAIEASANEARRHGFDGASCVHPSVVDCLNRAFLPPAEQVEWATRIVAAAETATHGAFSMDGKMVDAPVIAQARAVLDKARLS